MPLRRVLVVMFLSATVARAATTIDKLTAFPTDRTVRVQVSVRSDQPVDLEARIAPAKGTGPAIFEGPLGRTAGSLERTLDHLRADLWSPGSPTLYTLTVTARQGGRAVASQSRRIGFRSVAAKDGHVLLNGHPIFLKGVAISPPGRDVPDSVAYSREFAYAYVKCLREHNLNLMRMNFEFKPDPRTQVWFDACDELGMLVYEGNYGVPPGSARGRPVDPDEQPAVFEGKDPGAPRSSRPAPPADFAASRTAYTSVFEEYARHPSVIVYILSNEQPGPNKSNAQWHEFLSKMSDAIHAWDPTRLVIGNAGYGWGREGDVCDLHRYWGWYYNSFLTYYNLRDTVGMFGTETKGQPFTFSECVGSFTSPLGSFNAIFRKQLAPQLGWTGHAGDQPGEATAYQSFMVKHALESFRTMREQNPRLSGLMPFTILFYNWDVQRFEQMKAKPALEQMTTSYAPVLTSIELWTPQVYAGKPIRPVVHVVNDAEDFSDLAGATLKVEIAGKAKAAAVSKAVELPVIPYYGARSFAISLDLPDNLPAGDYALAATVEKSGRTISQNHESLYVASAFRPAGDDNAGARVVVYDPTGKTREALGALGVQCEVVTDLAALPQKPLVIGQEALTKTTSLKAVGPFVRNGGRVLVLAQGADQFDPSFLPAKVQMLEGTAADSTYPPRIRPTAAQSHVNPERPWHPVFKGIDRPRLRVWSDYTGWDQSKPGFPAVYPVTHGFKIADERSLAHAAILADYDRGLEGVALAEFFDGRGSVILSGFDLVNRAGLDPVADQLLANLVAYLASPNHETQPLVDKPIAWGDYPTERGVLTGPLQGLVYDCRWVAPPTDPRQRPMPDNTGAWNTRPGTPFVPRGIRPFGPYAWSTAASPHEESSSKTGTGFFHCRVLAGRRYVVSEVENPTDAAEVLMVGVNDVAGQPVPVAAKRTTSIRTPIPGGSTDLTIRYTGNKQLVILQTSFE